MREHFHTERYIFPVRYEVIRYVSGFLYLERFFLVAAVFQSCSFTDICPSIPFTGIICLQSMLILKLSITA